MNLLELIDSLNDELMDWYLYNYDIEELEDFITYLHKNGYNNEKVKKVFSEEELFTVFYQVFLKTIE